MGVLLASITTAPPAGAAAPSVTLPVLPAVPLTAAGLTLTPTSPAAGGGTGSGAAIFTPPSHAAVIAACATAAISVALAEDVVVALPATPANAGTAAASGGL